MNKAVFLDRDGVINDGTLYYTYKIEDFKFNSGVFEGLKLLQENGYKLIVITNQGGVAKGEFTIENVEAIHSYMTDILLKNGITINAIYYCPHHSDVSPCECRKPGTLMIEKAIKQFSIEREKSFLIGDSERDIITAQKAGIKSIKTKKNENILPWCKKIAENTI